MPARSDRTLVTGAADSRRLESSLSEEYLEWLCLRSSSSPDC